jgi:hypothetical protein
VSLTPAGGTVACPRVLAHWKPPRGERLTCLLGGVPYFQEAGNTIIYRIQTLHRIACWSKAKQTCSLTQQNTSEGTQKSCKTHRDVGAARKIRDPTSNKKICFEWLLHGSTTSQVAVTFPARGKHTNLGHFYTELTSQQLLARDTRIFNPLNLNEERSFRKESATLGASYDYGEVRDTLKMAVF